MSAPTHGPLRDILYKDNTFLNPSKWGTAQMHSLRIHFADAVQSNKPIPGDRTLAVDLDTDALAEIFDERDEHNPGCYSVNQAFATAIEALENHHISMECRRLWLHLGNRKASILPAYYALLHDVPAVAVNNPANVYIERQHYLTPDQTISYFSTAVEGAVDPVNVVQLIILAQAHHQGIKDKLIRNTYPLTV